MPDLNPTMRSGTAALLRVEGTPAFMSPEQIGSEELDGRTDLWSVGVTMYYLLSGVLPFGSLAEQSLADLQLRLELNERHFAAELAERDRRR